MDNQINHQLEMINDMDEPGEMLFTQLLRQTSSQLLKDRDERQMLDEEHSNSKQPEQLQEYKDKVIDFKQNSTFYQQGEEIFEDKNKNEKETKNSQSKKKFSIGTKNILINFKNFFVDYIKTHHKGANSDNFIIWFSQLKTVNRGNYEQLFKKSEYEEVLTKMFQERYISRQILISRSDHRIKALYLKKVAVFQHAFEKKWFPRIN